MATQASAERAAHNGLAIVVTNDYINSDKPLPTTHKDGEVMVSAFKYLNFLTVWHKNISKHQICEIIQQLPALIPQNVHGKEFVISFVFSGHGGEGDTLSMQDGTAISLNDDIVQPLAMCKKLADSPKLFFIDACRGSEDTVTSSTTTKSFNDRYQYSSQSNLLKQKSLDGNYYVAYATISRKKAFLKHNGSVWMQRLAQQLMKSNNSVQDIISETNRILWEEEYRVKDNTQQPEGQNRLNCGPLYLRAKSPFSLKSKTFRLYKLSDEDLPTSIPLIIPPGYQYDSQTYTVIKSEKSNADASSSTEFMLGEKAVEIIKKIDKPIAVFSICGPYRSGKSFFLSRFLGIKEAFKVGHTTKACTRGIWLSTTALICEQFVMLLIDSEGIDATGDDATTEEISIAILTLTSLLSSLIVYNSSHLPGKNDLTNIRMFGELSKSIVIRDSTDQDHNESIGKYLPDFYWLLRDIYRHLIPEGIQAATTFLKKEILQKSATGRDLLSLFPDLKCFSLPHPGCKPMHTHEEEKLGAEFVEGFRDFAMHILDVIRPKKGCSLQPIDGASLAFLAQQYITAINAPGSVPNLEQCWRNAAILNLSETVERLVQLYRSEMEHALSGRFPIEYYISTESTAFPFRESLFQLHETFLKQKIIVLKSKMRELFLLSEEALVSDKDYKEAEKMLCQQIAIFEKDTNTVIGGVLYEFAQENEKESYEACTILFTSLCPEYTFLKLDNIRKKYFDAAIGPEKDRVFNEHFRDIPGLPENIQVVNITHSQATLKWASPSQCIKLQYGILCKKECSDDAPIPEERVDNPFATLTNLTPMTNYFVRVFAINGRIFGECVDSSFTTTAGPPNKPHILDTYPLEDPLTALSIRFQQPTEADENGSKITQAIIKYGKINTGEKLEIKKIPMDHIHKNCIILHLENVVSPDTIKIELSFENKIGKGAVTDTVFDTKLMIPGPPEDVMIVGRGHERIKLRWKEPSINPGAVECYIVKMRTQIGGQQTDICEKSAKCLSAVGKKLVSDAKYNFQIRAVNSNKKGTSTKEFDEWIETKYHPAVRATLVGGAAVGGTIAAPVIAAVGAPIACSVIAHKGIEKENTGQVAAGMAGVAATPIISTVGLLAGTVGAPVGGGIIAKKTYDILNSDSDLDDSDNEKDLTYLKRQAKRHQRTH